MDERNRIQQGWCIHFPKSLKRVHICELIVQHCVLGKATLIVRLFGALQTKEIRDEKIQLIDRRIAEEEDKVIELEKSLK